MMKPDLIEQWKRYKKEGIVEDNYHGFDNLIEATIEALSPTIPDDVAEMVTNLHIDYAQSVGGAASRERKIEAADMLERQARHNSIQAKTLKLSLKNEQDLEQRIEELEAALKGIIAVEYAEPVAPVSMKAIAKAALAERNE